MASGHTGEVLAAQLAADLGDYLVGAAVITAGVGAHLLARRLQPFWVSRDGTRFITIARELDRDDELTGVRRDLHGGFAGGELVVKLRTGMRNRRSRYLVAERRRLDDRAWWYVLRPADDADALPAVAARVPADTPVAARLDVLLDAFRAASDP